MQRLQAFKYELMPNGKQHRDMRRFAGSCRFVFNKALAMQKERFEAGEKKLGYAGLCKLLTEWRNGTETPWLKDAPVHPLQQALKDLERAYANFECGYSGNADLNVARNILAAGHAVLACGESVQSGRSMKQEPAEVSQPAFG
jgi:transposase